MEQRRSLHHEKSQAIHHFVRRWTIVQLYWWYCNWWYQVGELCPPSTSWLLFLLLLLQMLQDSCLYQLLLHVWFHRWLWWQYWWGKLPLSVVSHEVKHWDTVILLWSVFIYTLHSGIIKGLRHAESRGLAVEIFHSWGIPAGCLVLLVYIWSITSGIP